VVRGGASCEDAGAEDDDDDGEAAWAWETGWTTAGIPRDVGTAAAI